MAAECVVREIHGWHTECSSCGYGSGGWRASPALQGLPILNTSSRTCPGCGATFTHTATVAGPYMHPGGHQL